MRRSAVVGIRLEVTDWIPILIPRILSEHPTVVSVLVSVWVSV